MKLLALLFSAVYFECVSLSGSLNSHLPRQYLCGNRLVHALSLICETYNSPSDVDEDYPQQNGIIETCCRKPCSRNILASYCGSLKADVEQSPTIHARVRNGYLKKCSRLKKSRKHKSKKKSKKLLKNKKRRKNHHRRFKN